MSKITADDNGTYIKTRNTTKLYCQVREETKGVCEESGKFYCNVKQSYISYERKYVSPDTISDDSKILYHGNAKKRVSLEKPYVRTNDQILSKAREFIDKFIDNYATKTGV